MSSDDTDNIERITSAILDVASAITPLLGGLGGVDTPDGRVHSLTQAVTGVVSTLGTISDHLQHIKQLLSEIEAKL